MASDASAITATDAPPVTRATPPVVIPSDEAVRLLKRPRSPSPSSPRSLAAQSHHLLASPAKSARLALAGTTSPTPLTGAAALEDERRRREAEQNENPPPTSENPSHKILASLMSGAVQAMSRPTDVPQPAPTASMESSPKAPNPLNLVQNSTLQHDEHDDLNPQDSVVDVAVTESPTPMDVDMKEQQSQQQPQPQPHQQPEQQDQQLQQQLQQDQAQQLSSQQVVGQEERPQPGSLSYPGSLQSTGNVETPARGMSYPMPAQSQGSPTSSATKKHKCPYCNTEFTRHHNLKSHLLTHSQEKPYVCTDCQMRFRRLHDLKRHGKLHTGEKPHVCPKCDRKFARGDALARHSKGAGGCAGRRSSMGSFADGDELDNSMVDPDDSNMSGLAYDNGDDEELRRQSLPSMNAQHVPGTQAEGYGSHARTYPSPRHGTGVLYPPNVNQNQAGVNVSANVANNLASGHTPNASISSIPVAANNANLYGQPMTESPKPLSPGQTHDTTGTTRQRSPSLNQQQQQQPPQQQQQQQQFGRRTSDLQSPHSAQGRPKLPGLTHPGFAAPNSTGFTHNRSGSGSQQGQQQAQNSESGNMFAQSDPSVWAYIQTLEEKVKTLSDKVMSLDQEVTGLKQQLDVRDLTAATVAKT